MTLWRYDRWARRRSAFWAFALVWTALLLAPNPAELPLVSDALPQILTQAGGHWDKVIHAAGYLCLALLALAAYGGPGRLAPRWVLAGGAAHGAVAEIIQAWLPLREADWLDWLADVTGLVVALALVAWAHRIRARNAAPE